MKHKNFGSKYVLFQQLMVFNILVVGHFEMSTRKVAKNNGLVNYTSVIEIEKPHLNSNGCLYEMLKIHKLSTLRKRLEP